MGKRMMIVGFAIGVVMTAGSAFAHHSFSAEFDASSPVTLKGAVQRFEWTNPHAWLFIDVSEPDGKTVTWAVEFGAPNALYRRGWRKEDVPVGAVITVQGFRAKNGKPIANAQNVVMPNGKTLFAGSSGSPGDSDGNR